MNIFFITTFVLIQAHPGKQSIGVSNKVKIENKGEQVKTTKT